MKVFKVYMRVPYEGIIHEAYFADEDKARRTCKEWREQEEDNSIYEIDWCQVKIEA